MPGRLMSIITTSGRFFGISLSAVSPLANSPVSLKPGARLISADRLLRMPSSSSTMAIFICMIFWDFLERGFAVGKFAGELETGRAFDQRRQAAADAFIVIHNGYFYLHDFLGFP